MWIVKTTICFLLLIPLAASQNSFATVENPTQSHAAIRCDSNNKCTLTVSTVGPNSNLQAEIDAKALYELVKSFTIRGNFDARAFELFLQSNAQGRVDVSRIISALKQRPGFASSIDWNFLQAFFQQFVKPSGELNISFLATVVQLAAGMNLKSFINDNKPQALRSSYQFNSRGQITMEISGTNVSPKRMQIDGQTLHSFLNFFATNGTPDVEKFVAFLFAFRKPSGEINIDALIASLRQKLGDGIDYNAIRQFIVFAGTLAGQFDIDVLRMVFGLVAKTNFQQSLSQIGVQVTAPKAVFSVPTWLLNLTLSQLYKYVNVLFDVFVLPDGTVDVNGIQTFVLQFVNPNGVVDVDRLIAGLTTKAGPSKAPSVNEFRQFLIQLQSGNQPLGIEPIIIGIQQTLTPSQKVNPQAPNSDKTVKDIISEAITVFPNTNNEDDSDYTSPAFGTSNGIANPPFEEPGTSSFTLTPDNREILITIGNVLSSPQSTVDITRLINILGTVSNLTDIDSVVNILVPAVGQNRKPQIRNVLLQFQTPNGKFDVQKFITFLVELVPQITVVLPDDIKRIYHININTPVFSENPTIISGTTERPTFGTQVIPAAVNNVFQKPEGLSGLSQLIHVIQNPTQKIDANTIIHWLVPEASGSSTQEVRTFLLQFQQPDGSIDVSSLLQFLFSKNPTLVSQLSPTDQQTIQIVIPGINIVPQPNGNLPTTTERPALGTQDIPITLEGELQSPNAGAHLSQLIHVIQNPTQKVDINTVIQWLAPGASGSSTQQVRTFLLQFQRPDGSIDVTRLLQFLLSKYPTLASQLPSTDQQILQIVIPGFNIASQPTTNLPINVNALSSSLQDASVQAVLKSFTINGNTIDTSRLTSLIQRYTSSSGTLNIDGLVAALVQSNSFGGTVNTAALRNLFSMFVDSTGRFNLQLFIRLIQALISANGQLNSGFNISQLLQILTAAFQGSSSTHVVWGGGFQVQPSIATWTIGGGVPVGVQTGFPAGVQTFQYNW